MGRFLIIWCELFRFRDIGCLDEMNFLQYNKMTIRLYSGAKSTNKIYAVPKIITHVVMVIQFPVQTTFYLLYYTMLPRRRKI